MKTNQIIGLGLLAATGAGVTFWLVNRRKPQVQAEQITEDTIINTTIFPLRQGSRGSEVKKLQNELLSKGGVIATHIATTGGADGVWGSGTQKAVIAAGWPTQISESDYSRLLASQTELEVVASRDAVRKGRIYRGGGVTSR